eukprot:scaffold2552_cov172-Alexandrium_tamarense.AAC.4
MTLLSMCVGMTEEGEWKELGWLEAVPLSIIVLCLSERMRFSHSVEGRGRNCVEPKRRYY